MIGIRALSVIGFVLWSAGVASAQTNLTWAVSQNGDWNVPENWSPANVPDVPAEAAVLSGPGPYTVSLFQQLGIWSLTIEDSAVSLVIESGGYLGVRWLENNGLIRMKAESGSTPARLYFNVGQTLSGNGELRMEGDALRPTIGSEVPFTNASTHRITGAGVIEDGLINDGLISANMQGKTLTLSAFFSKTNNAAMVAENGGILEIDNCYVGQGPDGLIRADGGVVQFIGSPIIYHGRLESANGGIIAAQSGVTLDHVVCDGEISARTIDFKGPELFNSGVITISSPGGGALKLYEDTVFTGGGELRLDNAGIYGVQPLTLTQAADHRIVGRGSIVTPMINYGLIETSGSGAMLQSGGFAAHLVNNGIVRAKNGALFAKSSGGASGTGEWIADGGILFAGSSLPDINLTGPTRVINGGELRAYSIGGWSASDLTVDATSSMHVAVRMALSGNYRFEQTNESEITWTTNSTLFMSGGIGASCSSASWASIEVGGRDEGVVGSGAANFGMENIVVTENASVALSDLADNGNRGGPSGLAEALYATSLTLESSAMLNLNGLHLYVGGAEIGPGAFGAGVVVDEPVHPAGDMNCDGVLNGLDVAGFVVAALTPETYPAQFPDCDLCAGDLDGDGLSATDQDLAEFVEALLSADAS